jgi:peptidoglycan/LPS O-acetylase OafA/YrhL
VSGVEAAATAKAVMPAPGMAGFRYRALDGLRGVCALLVCLFHFNAYGPVYSASFIKGSWLFVDFFFVLSGFVIASAWGDRVTGAVSAGKFAILRLGRIYPLHMFMLLAFLAMEVLGLVLANYGLSRREAFSGSHTIGNWLLTAGLLQIFGFSPGVVWNGPSWSIAAEFWTYLLFAGLLLATGKRAGVALLLAAIGALAMLVWLGDGIELTFRNSIWRCIYGFAVGTLVWRWTVSGRSPLGGTLAELLVLALVVGFVSFVQMGPWNLAAPLVFAIAVHVIAAERGVLSRLLLTDWAQKLGAWSYSIYLVHLFVQSRIDDVLLVLQNKAGMALLTPALTPDGRFTWQIGTSATQGLLVTALMLVLVLMVSSVTYKWIELPGQRWARRLSERLG